MLLEGTLVGTALRGMLAVDKRVVLFAILVGMRESYLYILSLKMDYRIDAVVCHCIVEQILKSVAAQDSPAVIHYGKPRVQISVIAEHRLYEIVVERIVLEQRGIRLEEDIRAVLVLRVLGSV